MASLESKIFASPAEPLFNVKSSGLSDELLEDTLQVLAELNEKRVVNPPKGDGVFKDDKAAEYVFLLCEYLELPPEAKYMAVELFDRFMTKHVSSLYDHVMKSDKYEDKTRGWETVESRMKRQLTLRIASCVQLASKLCSHYKIASVVKLAEFLQCLGHRYADDALVKSELRILETLDFGVTVPSPLTYIETILEIIGHNDENVNAKILHRTSLLLLDMVYLHYQHIYEQLYSMISSAACHGMPCSLISCGDAKLSPNSLRADLMFLAATIIGGAAILVDANTSKMVIHQVSLITRGKVQDIFDFSKVLLKFIQSS